MTDLTTLYLGHTLVNPLIVSSSPVTRDLDLVKKAEDAGAAAFVLHSLFEEQIEAESLDLHHHLEAGTESFAEATSYFPDMRAYNTGPDGYLEQLRKVKAAVGVPVFASLNGTSVGGWVRYARLVQDAGADGVELNVYDIPTDPAASAQRVEDGLMELVRAVRREITVPLAVKLSPFYTAPVNLLARLKDAGAAAAVLFNRFYQPDLNIDELDVVPHLKLSHSDELLTRLHWVGVAYGRVPIELAVTGGVHTARDVIKCVMAGASTAMLTSALIRHGVGYLSHILTDLRHWMAEKEYASVGQMRGALSLGKVPDPAAFERGNYMRVLRQGVGPSW
ncbi:dihydroorotate dehydrogenase-like protein [Urbifossiella limnaea]|uniref:NAD-dependent dihydropyrimidine dehydrogenase subunit PreA n=1 Tax=Urbifossiella limnaea TaxID=2528023 RepID=A0A517Y330_9BACT|nr:dihydroorotate dehydrogenase-like protein [Urbifossiella limnaea]QDU24226.1 NAD-dependent dihydropyrimidine dehydrogenase subunit PreA [Urbifossiella limnaea]